MTTNTATSLYTLCDPFAARFAVGHREDGGGVDDELELHLAAPLPGGLSPSLLDRAKLLPAVTADGNWTAKSDGSVPRRAKLEGVTVIQLRPRGPRSA